jgi:hypothetical protein
MSRDFESSLKEKYPDIKVIECATEYSYLEYKCRKCHTVYSFKEAAQLFRKKYPCDCLQVLEVQKQVADDVEILRARPLLWRCTRCKTVRKGFLSQLVKAKRACQCAGSVMATPKEEVVAKLKEAGRNVTMHRYTAYGVSCVFKCLVCKTTYEARPHDVVQGNHKCPTCKNNGRVFKQTKQYVRHLKYHLPNVTLVGKYIDVHTPIRHRCSCGYEWKTKPEHLLRKGKEAREFGCPNCAKMYCTAISKNGKFAFKSVRYCSKDYEVQGYEDIALYILEKKLTHPEKLVVNREEVPLINYRFNHKESLYVPDFYYPPSNCVIEVKSTWTFFEDFEKNCAKAKACKAKGYKFRLLLVVEDRQERYSSKIKDIPKDWYLMTREEAIIHVGKILDEDFSRYLKPDPS